MDLTVDFEIYFSQLLDFISVWILFSSDIGAACFRVYRMVMRMSRWGCNEEKNSARGKGQIQIQTQRVIQIQIQTQRLIQIQIQTQRLIQIQIQKQNTE